MSDLITITTISNDGLGKSCFGHRQYPTDLKGGMTLTDRIDALNFRIRASEPGYSTDYHVAGDPTLIIVQEGTIRITINNADHRDFQPGEMFIAEDFLLKNEDFDKNLHGHKAEVLGERLFKAVHIKLSSITG
ncbi:hypothetical protein [Roseivirga sp.]|uniref:hypothetical protein n=1 Tax=Roseivirga sp. TaxID=1964215 RepID=UPI003B8D4FE7